MGGGGLTLPRALGFTTRALCRVTLISAYHWPSGLTRLASSPMASGSGTPPHTGRRAQMPIQARRLPPVEIVRHVQALHDLALILLKDSTRLLEFSRVLRRKSDETLKMSRQGMLQAAQNR